MIPPPTATTTSQYRYSADSVYGHVRGKMPCYILRQPLNSVMHVLSSHPNQMEEKYDQQFSSQWFGLWWSPMGKVLQAFLGSLWCWSQLHSESLKTNEQGLGKKLFEIPYSIKGTYFKRSRQCHWIIIFQLNAWKYKKSVDVSLFLLSFITLFFSDKRKRHVKREREVNKSHHRYF